MANSIYFDNAATTPVRKEVLETMLPYFTEEFGNPSSIYTLGRNSKKAIDNARKVIAERINASASNCRKNKCQC